MSTVELNTPLLMAQEDVGTSFVAARRRPGCETMPVSPTDPTACLATPQVFSSAGSSSGEVLSSPRMQILSLNPPTMNCWRPRQQRLTPAEMNCMPPPLDWPVWHWGVQTRMVLPSPPDPRWESTQLPTQLPTPTTPPATLNLPPAAPPLLSNRGRLPLHQLCLPIAPPPPPVCNESGNGDQRGAPTPFSAGSDPLLFLGHE
jgi:hypothetical protein